MIVGYNLPLVRCEETVGGRTAGGTATKRHRAPGRGSVQVPEAHDLGTYATSKQLSSRLVNTQRMKIKHMNTFHYTLNKILYTYPLTGN